MVDGAETELGILSLTHLKKFFNPNPARINWMWNPNQTSQEYDKRSWEVRAFAEDTSDSMGPTWPPRSYTCTFCRREFRSAQALGGHMNVYRRDRAKLHHTPPPPTTTPTVVIPTQESFGKQFHNNLGFTNGQRTLLAINNGNRNYKDSSIGELDLELRLGQSSSQS